MKSTHSFIFFLSCAFSNFAFATTNLSSALPNYIPTVVATSATEYTVYTGKTFNNCTGNTNTSTCNSCELVGNTGPISGILESNLACNNSEVHSDLFFTIGLNSTVGANYGSCSGVIVGRLVGGTSTFVEPAAQPTFSSGQANQNLTVNFNWRDICSQLGGSSTCSASFSKTVEFGFDKDCGRGAALTEPGIKITFKHRYVGVGSYMSYPPATPLAYEGIAQYTIAPGDEKVFVRNVSGPTGNAFVVPDVQSSAVASSADVSGMKYSHFRVYYRPVSASPFQQMTTKDSYVDLSIDGTNLGENRVAGLTNDVTYEFLGANRDQGGNVTYFASPGILAGAVSSVTGKPSKVFGLLDGKKCFVATAAFGSELEPEVETFRQFRSQILNKSHWGRSFVAFYYRHSEAWASYISQSETRRTLVRGLLYPWLGVATLSLYFGNLAWLSGLVLFAFGLSLVIWLKKNRFSGRIK